MDCRLPWSDLKPVRGEINADYRDRIHHTVEMLNRHGLYVVLDTHFVTGLGLTSRRHWSARLGRFDAIGVVDSMFGLGRLPVSGQFTEARFPHGLLHLRINEYLDRGDIPEQTGRATLA